MRNSAISTGNNAYLDELRKMRERKEKKRGPRPKPETDLKTAWEAWRKTVSSK
jgi:hypothetical protein